MAWETDALIKVSFSRRTFNCKADVESFIEEKKGEIDIAKKTLCTLAYMTEPKKFCDEEYDPAWWIQRQLDEALETIEVNGYWIGVADHVLEAWDTMHHPDNGLALSDINRGSFDKLQRINGDFVKTCDATGQEITIDLFDMEDDKDKEYVFATAEEITDFIKSKAKQDGSAGS